MRLQVPLLAAAVLIPALAIAQPIGGPQRKAGWWEMTMAMTGPMTMTQTMHMCTDPATEKPGEVFSGSGRQPGNCTRGPITPTAGGWSFSNTCTTGQLTIATTGTARGDFAAGYHMDSVTTMTPAPTPQLAEAHLSVDAKWLGPCPAGKKPGDTEMVRR